MFSDGIGGASQRKVLVVEDDRDHAELIFLALEKNGVGRALITHCSTLAEAQTALDDPMVALVLLDYRLGDETSQSFLAGMRRAGDPRAVVVVTASGDEYVAFDSVTWGADDYIAKRDLDARLPDLLTRYRAWTRDREVERLERIAIASRFRKLTEREQEVLELILQGMLNKEIAHALCRSENTIKIHRAAIMRKMEAKTAADLVRLVLEARHASRSRLEADGHEMV